MGKDNNLQIALRISFVSIMGNVVLSAFKLFAGIMAKSNAMISDAFHSISDVLSTIVVIVGVKIASKESDNQHQYGHERMECVAAILLAGILCAIGIGIGYAGIIKIIRAPGESLNIPGTLALIAAVVSIVVKEGMFWYTCRGAKKIGSGALMADAWHHRSDALSSVGSFAGILGARLGFPIMDSVASVIISIFIVKASWDIFMDSIGKMVDKACDDSVVAEINKIIAAQEGVLAIDRLKTRLFGDKIYVDVEVSVDGRAPLAQAHDIAHQIHDAIEEHFPKVKHCMVHVNPLQYKEENYSGSLREI
ncbi:MAG: cation diffusion facilitator family transporter [Eubacteriales bacterium]|jgi:cation diffusion facilitator family transporter|nr:cation diffusion facilitator family transporter [Eubacteriales bacterium]